MDSRYVLWRKFHRIIQRNCVRAVRRMSGVEEMPPPGIERQTDVTRVVYISLCIRTGQFLWTGAEERCIQSSGRGT